jgi:hypothetical protein
MLYISKIKDKKHVIVSIDGEKPFDKNSTSLHDKSSEKLELQGTYLNIIKAIYNKPIANIILHGEKVKPFPLKSGTRQGCPLSHIHEEIYT